MQPREIRSFQTRIKFMLQSRALDDTGDSYCDRGETISRYTDCEKCADTEGNVLVEY